MCKYTIYHLECGHLAEDHVDSSGCSHYRQTSVACDRDNPANHARVIVKSRDREGKCNNCGRLDFEAKELQAMKREQDQARKQSLAEADERRKAAEAHEQKMEMNARAEWQRVHGEKDSVKSSSARTSSSEKVSQDSQRPSQPRKRDSHQEPTSATQHSTLATAPMAAQSSSIPPPPPMPSTTSPTQTIQTSLPTRPSSTQETPTSPQQSPSTDGPKLKATDYTLPAVGSQEYDRFMIGGRKIPIHESQKMEVKETKPSPLPSAPAPVGRLNGIIKPADIPSFSHMQSGAGQDTSAGRKPSITRKSSAPKPPVPAPMVVSSNDELINKLKARRKWEDELDQTADVLITPLESVSTNSTGSASSTSSGWTNVAPASAGQTSGGVEAATVLSGSVLDQKRRSGWR